MLKARCPSCGKSVSLEDADAGQAVVCLACGARYVAPQLPGALAAVAQASAGSAEAIPAGPRVGRTFWLALVLGALAFAGTLALVVRSGQQDSGSSDFAANNLPSKTRPAATEPDVEQVAPSTHPTTTVAVPTTRPRTTAAEPVTRPALVDVPASSLASTAAPATAASVGHPTVAAATSPSTPSTRPAVAAVPSTGPTTRPTTSPTAVARGPRPPIKPMPEEPEGVTDEQIGQAIQNGVNYLLSRFDHIRHTLETADTSNADGGGENALAVYALMQCGQAINDERLNVRGESMNAMIEAMKDSRLRRGNAQVYATGIRATALSIFNRPQDKAVLRQDVLALIQAHSQGAYTYIIDPNRSKQKYASPMWDNSNSQYGLLGVWSGAEANVEVPQSYWAAVETHWVDTQLPNGQWDYGGERSGRVSMTAAGIASLFVTHDWLDAAKSRVVGREPFSPALQRGLDWFETGDNAIELSSEYWFYTLYGVERVGLASGFKYFGKHDWYRRLASNVLAQQSKDGSWGTPVDTSFALLFLARGRHPILMNKVRFNGYWANRPRDLSNLSRYAAHQLERELNWQVVPLRPAKAWTDWLDSPILYLSSHKEPRLLKEDYDNLRQFVAAGGLLFTQADGDSEEFNKWAADLAGKLFQKYEMKELPADHPIYNLVYKIEDDERPPLKGVSNGSRLLMVHSPVDIAKWWQLRDARTHKGTFQLGVNLFLYAAGKRDLRNRLDSTFVSDPGPPINGSLQLARIEYPGNWDPEPAAWSRFARWFQRQTGTGLNVHVVKLSALKPGVAPIVHLTGTTRYDFSAEEASLVKNYVEAGGVLVVDQVGGTGNFDKSVVDDLLGKAFPGKTPAPLDPTEHPLFRAGPPTSGREDLTKPKLRQFTVPNKVEEATPILGFASGKGHVVYTPIDVTSGLLGTRTWGIHGLHPDYAPAFVKNFILWTLDGQVDNPDAF